MSQNQIPSAAHDSRRLHWAGVVCGLCAGVWLGAAEAPTKLVNAGLSPFAVSLCMVSGVFAARWTLPTLLKGTSQVAGDLMRKKYLIIWALLAGMMWAVANTLTVFAIRDVGLTIAFPLWNTNSLIGRRWGRLRFGELKKASPANIARVVIGTIAIVAAATLLGFSTMHGGSSPSPHALQGILAALGASLLWGTMYIPYRKAYISGMNPLSFVTAFTFGELGTVFALVWFLDGGAKAPIFHTVGLEHLLFWLFVGGFVWVIGDIFQQFATKYLGIGRGIPLSNTNQLWGLAWGALVFGELANATATQRIMVIAGSLIMIGGAIAISTAVATQREQNSMQAMLQRECDRYNLDMREVVRDYSRPEFDSNGKRSIGDYAIVATATAVFLYLGWKAKVPQIAFNLNWVVILVVVMLVSVGAGIIALRRLSNS